jgi:hypothetical protein
VTSQSPSIPLIHLQNPLNVSLRFALQFGQSPLLLGAPLPVHHRPPLPDRTPYPRRVSNEKRQASTAQARVKRVAADAEGNALVADSLTTDLNLYNTWGNWIEELPTWMTGEATPLISLPGPSPC